MADEFLNRIYAPMSQDATTAVYDDWAASYDAEVGENGYVTPTRLAALLMDHLKTPDMPILDYGCGTGLSGLALRAAGFTTLDGTDPSPGMLDIARAKGIYRSLTQLDLEADPILAPGAYPVIAAVGVIGTGAAPPETFDTLMQALPRGGILTLSLNDHALADPVYEGALNGWLDCGAARLLVKDHGDHLPGKSLNSNVYIIEKA